VYHRILVRYILHLSISQNLSGAIATVIIRSIDLFATIESNVFEIVFFGLGT